MDESSNVADRDLEWQLKLLHSLAAEIEQAQAALLRSDLHGIEVHVARQQDLCQQLQELGQIPSQGRPALLREEIAAVVARVRYLNAVHCGLLVRARRTLAILERLLVSSCATYGTDAVNAQACRR